MKGTCYPGYILFSSPAGTGLKVSASFSQTAERQSCIGSGLFKVLTYAFTEVLVAFLALISRVCLNFWYRHCQQFFIDLYCSSAYCLYCLVLLVSAS